MSMTRHPRAALRGWEAPFYPDNILQLAQALERRGDFDGVDLERIGRAAQGFVSRRRYPAAADGYIWFWTLQLQDDGEHVLAAIPWSHDWEKQDGYGFDRSPAVYLQNNNMRPGWTVVGRLIVAAGTVPRSRLQDDK